jgi:hypothetical protein
LNKSVHPSMELKSTQSATKHLNFQASHERDRIDETRKSLFDPCQRPDDKQLETKTPCIAKSPRLMTLHLYPLHFYSFYHTDTDSSPRSVQIYWIFFPLVDKFNGTGLLHSQSATNATHPVTVTAIPEIQGHAPLITQLLGHSS